MNNIQKSMKDIAFELLSKKKNPVAFNKLWKEVTEVLGLTDEEAASRIGTFYTHITLDGRFVLLENNTWDLRSRQKSEKWKIDMNALYKDDGDNAYSEDLDGEDLDEESDEENEESEFTTKKYNDSLEVEEE